MATVLPIALMVGGTLMSAMGQANQASSQAAAANYSAAAARQSAGLTEAAGSAAAMEQNRKTQYALSDTAAAAGGAGVNPGVGSPLAQTGRIAKWGTYNQLMAMYDAKVQSTSLQNEAGGYDFEAQQANASIPWRVGGTLLSGADTLYSKYG